MCLFGAGGIALALAAPAGAARAGGLFVGENGSQAQGRAGAFTAKADDPTALQHNPAGLASATRIEAFLGLNLVDVDARFQRHGTYQAGPVGEPFPEVRRQGGPLPIPFAAVTIPHGKLAFSAGIFAPHMAAGGKYPERVRTRSGTEAPAPQRYDVTSLTGIAALPSVAAAYRVSDRLRVGLRLSHAFAETESTVYAQAIANEEEQPGLDSVARVKASDFLAFGWGAGLHYRAGAFELALAYSSPVRFNLKGEADIQLGDAVQNPLPIPGLPVEIAVVPVPDAQARCAPGGRPGALKACIDLELPQTASTGVRWVARRSDGRERGDIELDVRWEDLSATSELRATVDAVGSARVGGASLLEIAVPRVGVSHGFRDSFAFRLGASRSFFPAFGAVNLRGGLGYDTAAAPVSWTRLDIDGAPHFTASGGVGLEFARWRLDLAAAFVTSPRRVVVDQGTPPNTPPAFRVQPDIPAVTLSGQTPVNPFNAGVYERSYLIGSAGVTVWF